MAERAAIERVLAAAGLAGPVGELAPLTGGAVNDVWLVTRPDGSRLVVKAAEEAPGDLFAIEAAVFPEGHRYDVGIIWSDADPTPVLSGLRDRLAHAPSLKTEILVAVTPPPTIDPSAREMAYSMAAPLYIGASLKVAYDILMWRAFRHLRPE